MSRAFFRRPEFRLLLGYPSVTLHRGAAGPVATADLSVPDAGAALAALAGTVSRAGGRLTAVLPEDEVWRGMLALPARAPLARRRLARAAAADGLADRPDGVAVVLGRPDASGRTPVAAVRRSVLAEARRFMARAGLRPAAVTGAGSFPGFAVPPRLRSGGRATPGVLAAAAAACVIAGLGLALALRPASEPTLPPVATAPVPVLVAAAPPAPDVLRPVPRPADFAAPVTRAAAVAPQPAEPSVAKPPAPKVTVAARNVDVLPPLPKHAAPSALRLAELATARSRLADVTSVLPFRRPAPAAAPEPEPVAAAEPPPASAVPAAIRRPLPRPAERAAAVEVAPAVAIVALAEAVAAAADRPMPRPARPAAAAPVAPAAPEVQVASLGNGPEVAALVAAALQSVAPPEPRVVAPAARPAAPAAKPAPQRQAAPQPAPVAQPKPAVQRQAAPQPARAVQPKPVVQAAPQPARVVQPAKPAVQRQAAPKPTRVARAAPAPEPARQRRGSNAAPARSGIVLVGIFGSTDDRHALVQLPNGAVKRVSAGDSVQGVQVAAIGSDGVRLRGSGRESVLRLPD